MFINKPKSLWAFDNLAAQSTQQLMIGSNEFRILEDKLRGLDVAVLSLLLHFVSLCHQYWRKNYAGVKLTEFEDGEDKAHFVLPGEILSGVAEEACGTEDDHLVDGMLFDGMVDLVSSTAPVG
jgi:hypothetical protein